MINLRSTESISIQMTTLESLENALFFDLFEFLDAIHLLGAFHGLNSRIESLLRSHYQAYRLDFRFALRKSFNYFCDEHLPEINDRTISLHLSNDSDTPQQLQLFFLRDNPLSQLTYLKSFTLQHVFSDEVMRQISCELQNLPVLTRLNIIQCHLPRDQSDNLFFINRIWSLPSLISCKLDVQFREEEFFSAPNIASSSIKYVTITGIFIDFTEISRLLEQTPNMNYLQFTCIDTTDQINESLNSSSLSTLNISFIGIEEEVFITFVQQMFGLRRLAIKLYYMYVDGYQWEHIIRTYLPNLKIFELLEQILIADLNYVDENIEALLKTFQSEFWLNERQWFIQCNWILTDNFLFLYTLPYSFEDFAIGQIMISKSTRPQNMIFNSYRRVNTLIFNPFAYDDEPLLEFCFPSVRHLTVASPLNDHFRSILPKLDRLTSINIHLLGDDSDIAQLQVLLNLTINLRSLSITSSSPSQIMSLIDSVNVSVRRLNLQSTEEWFDDKQCMVLGKSQLTRKCEMLTICIKSCIQAPDLVQNMIKLRALKIACEDDYLKDVSADFVGDSVVYLRRCLKSAHVDRDATFRDYICIWIQ